MKFICVGGLTINCDHIVMFSVNKLTGDVVLLMTVTKIDIAFPNASEFIRQFEELHLAPEAPQIIES